MSDVTQLGAQLEAILLLATEPVPLTELAAAVEAPEERTEKALKALQDFYDETGRGFELRRVGLGWRFYTRDEYAEVVTHWLIQDQVSRLTPAALETLSVVAYLQPISKSRISGIRGVNVDGVVRTLSARELISVQQTDPESGAHLYGTTSLFLEKMGLTSLDELPPIAPYLPDAMELEAELVEIAAAIPLPTETALENEPEEDIDDAVADGIETKESNESDL